MFPHPCGPAFEAAVAAGADPRFVVPDESVVVRGGTRPMPDAGETFSCMTGPDLEAAGCAVQHGQLRATTAGAIRAAGGSVEWLPDTSPRGIMNFQHVHVTEVGASSFSDLMPNSVPRRSRIDGGK